MSQTPIYVSADNGPSVVVHDLPAARCVVRQMLAERSTNVVVKLSPGTHRLTETLVFSPQDCSHEGLVHWTADATGDTFISGATPLEDWQPLSEARPVPACIPTGAIEHLWVTSIPRSIPDGASIGVLFDVQGMLPRAGIGPFQTDTDQPCDTDFFHHRSDDAVAWKHWRGAEVAIAPSWPWAFNLLPVACVDEQTHRVRVARPATYPLTTQTHGHPSPTSGFYRIENVPAGLTKPGSWFVDPVSRLIYLWPRQSGRPTGVEVPLLVELLRVEGDFENNRWVRNLRFSGLCFTGADRYAWTDDRHSLQHDWEQYDSPTAMLRLRGAENVAVEHCRFANAGAAGVRLDLHAQNCSVRECVFSDLGATAITLAGYGPGTRDEHRGHVIRGNYITRAGQLWLASAGIFISQSSDNIVSDNLIEALPYAGIVVSGLRRRVFDEPDQQHEGQRTVRTDETRNGPFDWPDRAGFIHSNRNIIEYNEVRHVMQRLGDGNGIYLSGAGTANVVRHNFVHDIVSRGAHSGIRLDDEQWHAWVTMNLVLRCNGGITVKHINEVSNNIIIDCSTMAAILVRSVATRGAAIRRNVLIYTGSGDVTRKTPWPFYLGGGIGGDIHEPAIDDNLYWSPNDQSLASNCLALMREHGQETRTWIADPQFADLDLLDLRLSDDSPCHLLGFRTLTQVGVRACALTRASVLLSRLANPETP